MKNQERVVVTDIDMPFLSIVIFMVKWSLAAVPAIIILWIIWALVIGFVGGLAKA